jgi:hypothetical protein
VDVYVHTHTITQQRLSLARREPGFIAREARFNDVKKETNLLAPTSHNQKFEPTPSIIHAPPGSKRILIRAIVQDARSNNPVIERRAVSTHLYWLMGTDEKFVRFLHTASDRPVPLSIRFVHSHATLGKIMEQMSCTK